MIEITGLRIEPAPTRMSANLLIIFSTEALLRNELLQDFGIRSAERREALFRCNVCLGNFSLAGDASIARAAVILPVDRASAHAKLVDSLLSGLDYLLLKMLYDPRIKPGMNLLEATPVLKTIAEEFERNQMIETAEARVRTGRLYEWVD